MKYHQKYSWVGFVLRKCEHRDGKRKNFCVGWQVSGMFFEESDHLHSSHPSPPPLSPLIVPISFRRCAPRTPIPNLVGRRCVLKYFGNSGSYTLNCSNDCTANQSTSDMFGIILQKLQSHFLWKLSRCIYVRACDSFA